MSRIGPKCVFLKRIAFTYKFFLAKCGTYKYVQLTPVMPLRTAPREERYKNYQFCNMIREEKCMHVVNKRNDRKVTQFCYYSQNVRIVYG